MIKLKGTFAGVIRNAVKMQGLIVATLCKQGVATSLKLHSNFDAMIDLLDSRVVGEFGNFKTNLYATASLGVEWNGVGCTP